MVTKPLYMTTHGDMELEPALVRIMITQII